MASVAHGVPELAEWVGIMNNRLSYLQLIALNCDDACCGYTKYEVTAFEQITDEEYISVKFIVDSIATLKSDADENGLLAVAKGKVLAENVAGVTKMPWRVLLSLRAAAWDPAQKELSAEVPIILLEDMLKPLLVAVQSEAAMLAKVQDCILRRQALVLPNMEALTSVAALEFDSKAAQFLENADEVKAAKKILQSSAQAMKALVLKCDSSCADVKRMIEKKQKEDETRLEKDEQSKVKAEQKRLAQANKEKKAKAKAQAKKMTQGQTTRVVAGSSMKTMPPRPAICDGSGSIKAMQVYDDEAKLMLDKPPVSKPYVVKVASEKLKSLLGENGVKSCMALYKIAAMESPSFK